jgi:hypothetical protein
MDVNINSFKTFFKEIKKLSSIFHNFEKNYFKSKLKYSYNKKSSINDGLLFILLKTQKYKNQQSITVNINLSFKKDVTISRQSLIKRSTLISYNDLLFLKTQFENISLKKYNMSNNILVDGTYINVYNKNINSGYEKIVLLGVYDDDNKIPINLYKNSNEKKSELMLFYDYLNNNQIDEHKIIIVDRLYFSEKTINLCYDKKLCFICRLKKNSIYLKNINETNKDYILKTTTNKYIRIISFEVNNKTYFIATNILDNKKYDTNFFIVNYKKRWNVEIFFKITKNNTCLEHIKTHDKNKINIEILSINIISIIFNYIINSYYKICKNKKINNSLFIQNFYDHLLINIVKGCLKEKYLIKIMKIIISYIENKNINKNNPRIAKKPNFKWHIKFKLKKK